MAENPVVGKPGTHCGVKGLDVVDGLADKLALSEQILVNVGDLARVGIQADISANSLAKRDRCDWGRETASLGWRMP